MTANEIIDAALAAAAEGPQFVTLYTPAQAKKIAALEARIARKSEAVRLQRGKVSLAKDRRPKSSGRIQSPAEIKASARAQTMQSELWTLEAELKTLKG